jgi:P27 family predicted phage terminase small subunit
MSKNKGFLTATGQEIYDRIEAHCKANNILFDIDEFELRMLANSFDLYIRMAAEVNEDGATQSPKEGGWDQVRPEYTVMKNEYQNILKHSSKFGLNPGDRAKIFAGMKQKKKKGFEL